jgi:hypothetical protein
MRAILLALLALATASCMSVVVYGGESAGPVARLRVAVPKDYGNKLIWVWQYADDQCQGEKHWVKLNNDLLLPSPATRLGIPLWDYNDRGAKEFKVRANDDLYLLLKGEASGASCGVPVKARLEEGRDYELLFTGSIVNGCSVTLSEITAASAGATKRAISQFANVGNDECRDAFGKGRFW